MAHYIGLDLGGTNIKAGIVDDKWQVVARHSIPTESEGGPDHVISRLELIARQVAEQAGIDWSDVTGIGIGTPGPCTAEGVVLMAPNLHGWQNVPLQANLSAKLGMKVAVVNDANAAAYGEFIAGAGKDDGNIRHMILLTLGTGVGGGIIINRELFVGPNGAGAELGHTIVELGGRLCGCGQHGCLEQYGSASAIVREARQRIEAGETTSMPAEPSAKDVFDHAQQGDKLADAVIEEACKYLAAGIATLLHSFDSQYIVLGGGVAAAGEPLLERVRHHLTNQYWKVAPLYAKVVAAQLGNDAGFIGAAAMVQGRVVA